MSETMLPKAWEGLISKGTFLPVIIKTLERIHDTTWSMEPSRHDHFEMVYIKRGNAVFHIAGQDVHMGPNDIVIIKPFQLHKFNVKSQAGCEFIVLSFKFQDQRDKEYSDISLNDFIEFVKNKESGSFITLKVSRKNDIVYVMNRILREREKQDIWGDFLSYLLIMELFVLVSRALKMEWEESIKNKSLKLKELMHIAKQYMEVNYEKDLTLTDVSKYVFLSQSYFAHAFKEEFDISPKSYLLKVRIDKSKELLEKTDLKISDVALSVGFSSQQRYNDMFKKYVGMTPLKYRKKVKADKLNK
ncbi:AraC family transcriptional regulator [Petroclostridium sp. X23]|uniref:AraC family transcriptional regulator n=1 Tax=Petroclostridium sp. X23 TaxID=3045146 RepID=UPI0024ACEE0F|nr:AraC family transcriptional regulator [Petroclostridium sp. X23]WHH57315.1 AraC family transcriptional regulator [Petroclostridium sp. X23]